MSGLRPLRGLAAMLSGLWRRLPLWARETLGEAGASLAAALLLAGIMIILILTARANAQELTTTTPQASPPSTTMGPAVGAGGSGTLSATPLPGAPGVAAAGAATSSVDLRAQEVNTGSARSTACACALGGAAGACLTKDALHKVRDAATIELPSCRAQLAARGDEVAAIRGALSAEQARCAVLSAANLDRKAAGVLTDKASALSQPASAPSPSWTERHGLGLGLALGVAAGAAVTIGIVYALLPARPTAATSGSSAGAINLAPPLLRWR